MTRIQRIFLALAIPFFAWLLHVNTCDWHYRANVSFYSRTLPGTASEQSRWWIIWGRLDPDTSTGPGRAGGMVATGLTTNQWIHLDTALVWGIFIPLALITADIWWMLGWRRRHRLATGCCAACGYDLKGSPTAAKCPECGAVVPRT